MLRLTRPRGSWWRKPRQRPPEVAGRYHAPAVAARALTTLEDLAPAYLRVQVARLEALGTLTRWLPVEPAPPVGAAKKKKKTKQKRKRSRRKAGAAAASKATTASESESPEGQVEAAE